MRHHQHILNVIFRRHIAYEIPDTLYVNSVQTILWCHLQVWLNPLFMKKKKCGGKKVLVRKTHVFQRHLKYFCYICVNVCHQETELFDITPPVHTLRRLQKQPLRFLMLNLYVSGSLSHSRMIPVAFPFSFRICQNTRGCYGFVVEGSRARSSD